jgi:hypothetical protein
MRDRCRQVGVLMGAILATHCRAEPPSSVAPTAVAAAAEPPAAVASAVTPPTRAALAPAASVAPAPTPSASVPASAAVESDEPPLLDANGTPLPQTDARPSVTNERFQRRMQHVADSILTGDLEKARSSFFPLVAYAQVKDVQKPERDYRYRLMAHFERDLREYRKRLGKDVERVEFLGVTVPEARVEWMKPGKEGNRLGYFRVLRSSLRFRLASGKEQSLELTSMISWRGEWYVVHLNGFE